LQICYLESIDSTQKHLKELLKDKRAIPPYAVVGDMQTDGIGSRDNVWTGYKGNLFLSFAIHLDSLTNDLKLESASIYFAYILKDTLSDFGSDVWLKWPNDFYINDKKIGGMITNVIGDTIICGVGINMLYAPEGFATLDIKIDRELLLEQYFKNIKKTTSWKQVFSKYELEFYKNQNFFTHNNNLRVSLKNVSLQEDGSIVIDGERIYSLR